MCRDSGVELVVLEVSEHAANDAAFDAADRFGMGVTHVATRAVIGLSGCPMADLVHCDAVEGGVDFAVSSLACFDARRFRP